MSSRRSYQFLWCIGAICLGGVALPAAGLWLLVTAVLAGAFAKAAAVGVGALTLPIIAGWLFLVLGGFDVVVE